MSENNKKILPIDYDSDYSLPGRFEESNTDNIIEVTNSKSTSKVIVIGMIIFAVFAVGFFSYYFLNQEDIDSRIIQSTLSIDPEQRLADRYGIGIYGSAHEHAAIAVFVNGEQINFGLEQFQLSSRYIHFENDNPYLLHKHATDVPLVMLFSSIGMKIDLECIILTDDNKNKTYCSDADKFLSVYVNGKKYDSDISQYEIKHNDRILISFGDGESISNQLRYLEALKIFDIPKKTPGFSDNNINI